MDAGKNAVHDNNATSFLAGAGTGDEGNNERNGFIRRPEDEMMPLTVVSRIMRNGLPPKSKISDEAKTAVQSCVSEYISFITSEANDRSHREMRKTIFAEDILYALSKLGFGSYVEPLTLYLNRYRQYEADRGEPASVRRTVSYPLAGLPVQHSPPTMYYPAPDPATQFAPLHPNTNYYRVPPAPAAYTDGLTLIPVYGSGGGGGGGYGGVPFNAMGAVSAQVCSPRGEHFITVNAQPTSPGGSGDRSPSSTSDDGQHPRGNAGVAAVRNMRFNAPGNSRGGGRRRRRSSA